MDNHGARCFSKPFGQDDQVGLNLLVGVLDQVSFQADFNEAVSILDCLWGREAVLPKGEVLKATLIGTALNRLGTPNSDTNITQIIKTVLTSAACGLWI